MPGKRIEIDGETWPVLDLLARDRMMTFQELADEAFAGLLKKHNRPVLLKTALRQSVKQLGSAGALGRHRSKKITAVAPGDCGHGRIERQAV